MDEGVEAQIIATFLIPDNWDEDMMGEWLTNLMAMDNGEGLNHFFFAYECETLYLSGDWLDGLDGKKYHVLQLGRPTETEIEYPEPDPED